MALASETRRAKMETRDCARCLVMRAYARHAGHMSIIQCTGRKWRNAEDESLLTAGGLGVRLGAWRFPGWLFTFPDGCSSVMQGRFYQGGQYSTNGA